MEQQRYYFQVGLFVLVTLIVGSCLGLWLSAHADRQLLSRYAIYFNGSVDGLSEGSPVRYKGLNVGQVRTMALNEDDKVRVVIEIYSSTPIRKETSAALQLLGITGTSCVSLDNALTDTPMQEATNDPDYPVIPSRVSSIDKVFASAPELIDALKKLASRGEKLLSDETIANVNGALKGIERTTTTFAAFGDRRQSLKDGTLPAEMNDVASETRLTLHEVRLLARSLRKDPSQLIFGRSSAADEEGDK